MLIILYEINKLSFAKSQFYGKNIWAAIVIFKLCDSVISEILLEYNITSKVAFLKLFNMLDSVIAERDSVCNHVGVCNFGSH